MAGEPHSVQAAGLTYWKPWNIKALLLIRECQVGRSSGVGLLDPSLPVRGPAPSMGPQDECDNPAG